MTTVENYTEGAPCWADLVTTDVEAARSFYGSLFGWNYDAYPMPSGDGGSMTYYMSTVGGKNVVGLMQMSPEMGITMPSAWNTYLATADADATAAKIADAGGALLYPVDEIPGSGRMAMARDPLGAVFGIWQAKGHIGSGVTNEAGTVLWNELWAPDAASATPFYATVFGIDPRATEIPGAGDYTELFVDGTSSAGVMTKPEPELPDMWVLYFGVDDVDDAVTRAVALGATVMAPAFEVEGVGRMAGLSDPQGALFFVMRGES